jgi:cytochrome c
VRSVAFTAASGLLGVCFTVLTVVAYSAPPQVSSTDSATVVAGKRLILFKGCGGCHTVPGVVGANGEFAPYLGGVGNRPRIANGAVANSGPDDLVRWILDPPAMKPGTVMPKLGLNTSEAVAIVSYLETLP